jgi:hypothetical protein
MAALAEPGLAAPRGVAGRARNVLGAEATTEA